MFHRMVSVRDASPSNYIIFLPVKTSHLLPLSDRPTLGPKIWQPRTAVTGKNTKIAPPHSGVLISSIITQQTPCTSLRAPNPIFCTKVFDCVKAANNAFWWQLHFRSVANFEIWILRISNRCWRRKNSFKRFADDSLIKLEYLVLHSDITMFVSDLAKRFQIFLFLSILRFRNECS